jgi:hypothetical protein
MEALPPRPSPRPRTRGCTGLHRAGSSRSRPSHASRCDRWHKPRRRPPGSRPPRREIHSRSQMNAVLSEKEPIFLIMDASPIVMLSAIERLDWLMERADSASPTPSTPGKPSSTSFRAPETEMKTVRFSSVGQSSSLSGRLLAPSAPVSETRSSSTRDSTLRSEQPINLLYALSSRTGAASNYRSPECGCSCPSTFSRLKQHRRQIRPHPAVIF